MRRWNLSIRAWLASLGAAVALPVLLLLTWMFGLEVRHESDYAQTIGLRIAKTTAARIASQHERSAELLDKVAQRTAGSGSPCKAMSEIADLFPVSDLLFYDRNGALACAAAPRGRLAAAEVRYDDLRAYRPMVRLVRGQWILALSQPAGGGTLAILRPFDFAQMEAPLPNAVITIVDRDGTVIARSVGAEGIVGRNVGNAEMTKIARGEEEGRSAARGLDGVLRQYGFRRVPALQWTIFAGVPATHVMGSEKEMYLFGIAGGALIVLIITIATFFVSREIEKPVIALMHAAESVAQSGYGRVEPTAGPAEIARLSAAFNEMVARRSTAEQHLKALSERLLTVQEQERMRVAREIHDDLGQALTALKMDIIGLVEKTRPSPEMRPMVDRILRTIDSTMTSVQRISSELRPSVLDDLGLFAAIESEARLFEERTGIECEISIPEDLAEIDSASSVAIYRIFQEALTNVARHSNASRVEVRVRERSGELFLEIRDDGRGIVSEQIEDPASLGLAGIRERAGMLGGTALIEGIPGRGTIVSVRIPHGAQT